MQESLTAINVQLKENIRHWQHCGFLKSSHIDMLNELLSFRNKYAMHLRRSDSIHNEKYILESIENINQQIKELLALN